MDADSPPPIDPQQPPPKRSFAVTLLVVLVLTYTVFHGAALSEALRHWDFLLSLTLSVSPVYLAARSAFWLVTGLALAVGLWSGHRWAWFAAQIGATLYTIYYWLDRLFFADTSVIIVRWPFILGLTILCLAFIFFVLRLPKSRQFFKIEPETTK
jgi:hypothetical protein